MKTPIFICFLLTFATSVFAKETPRANLKVSYNYHFLSVRSDGELLTHDYQYILLANCEQSKFYNIRNEYLDSLKSTPSGRAVHKQIMNECVRRALETGDYSTIPHYEGKMYIFKSAPDAMTTVYDGYESYEYGYYSEPFSEIEWNICDSTKTVLGYRSKASG